MTALRGGVLTSLRDVSTAARSSQGSGRGWAALLEGCSSVHWAAAPLVAGCEPLSPSRRALGWTATILSLLALAFATGVAAHGGAAFIRARDKRRALPRVLFPSAVLSRLPPSSPWSFWPIQIRYPTPRVRG